jgi:hypothetical protein
MTTATASFAFTVTTATASFAFAMTAATAVLAALALTAVLALAFTTFLALAFTAALALAAILALAVTAALALAAILALAVTAALALTTVLAARLRVGTADAALTGTGTSVPAFAALATLALASALGSTMIAEPITIGIDKGVDRAAIRGRRQGLRLRLGAILGDTCSECRGHKQKAQYDEAMHWFLSLLNCPVDSRCALATRVPVREQPQPTRSTYAQSGPMTTTATNSLTSRRKHRSRGAGVRLRRSCARPPRSARCAQQRWR